MSFHLVCILSSFLGVIVFPFNYICEFWENLGGCELYKVTEIGGTATIYISGAFTPLCSSDPLLSVTAVCQFNAAECCSLRWQKSVCFQTTNPFERLRLLLSMFFVFFLSPLLFPPPFLYHFLLKQSASSLAWKGDRWRLQAERMVAVLIAWINVGALFSSNCLSRWFVVC